MAKSFNQLVRRTATPAVQRRAAARTRELLSEMLLGELRQVSGRSQRDVAEALGIKQPSLSKIERQSDIQVSTLGRLIHALGGELVLLVRISGKTVRIRQFDRGRGDTRTQVARGAAESHAATARPATRPASRSSSRSARSRRAA